MSWFGAVVLVSVVMLGVAALLVVWRVFRPDTTLANRAVAMDTLTALLLCGLAVGVAADGDGLWLDILLVLGLLGFLATVTVARYIERRGS
jgi:multicomponent Na+:H+ antiporter subunit F